MGIFLIFGLSKESIIYSILFSILLVISIIDYRHFIIPNGLIIGIFLLAIINLFLDFKYLFGYIIGFFAASIILLILSIITRGKMGGGDIKLMAAAGFLLGWQKILLALMIGSIFGAVTGIILIGLKIIKREQMIPFGPFLSIGIFISALYSEPILLWYLRVIMNN